jgi:hypothetical protein
VGVKPELETARARPGVPLTVPTLLALATWALALSHWRAGPRLVNDPVAGELRQFRSLTDPEARARAIFRLISFKEPFPCEPSS